MTIHITESDIAEAAGVSQAAVSRILNGRPASIRVSAKTRDRILAIARQCGYQPNRIARDMALRRKTTLGLILTLSDPDLPIATLAAMDGVITAAGFRLILTVLPSDLATARDRVTALLHDGVGGFLCGAGAMAVVVPVVAGTCPVVVLGIGAGETLLKALGVSVVASAPVIPTPPVQVVTPVVVAIPGEAAKTKREVVTETIPSPASAQAPTPVPEQTPVHVTVPTPTPEPPASVPVMSEPPASVPVNRTSGACGCTKSTSNVGSNWGG